MNTRDGFVRTTMTDEDTFEYITDWLKTSCGACQPPRGIRALGMHSASHFSARFSHLSSSAAGYAGETLASSSQSDTWNQPNAG